MRPDKIFMGLVIMSLGFAMLALSSLSEHAEVGGVVIIGPIPIVIGSSPEMAFLGIVMAVVMLLLAYSFTRW
ncbi:TIGR00304 family membrane protein [Archaeoglobus veneficus]|uniref:DUF131 domain-containing protein n=1 Tax=Archaeoglobus veneficus (strain DSM 11195 / SNP6) TaxID=693661 RepID=F2KPE1_ARCVS|nr:DUF131 domain-containing protein [Archaeoglobus veneficus]AEA46372.1 protein of unknown function DUF131 [Archaeoglobus veneficus SNP6]